MHYKGLFDWKGGWKNERIENILISFLSVWLWVKKWKDGKSEFGQIYSDTIVKKWCPIKKKKKWQTTKKHYSHPNLLKNKNHVLEKIMYKKKKKTLSHPSPRKKRKRQRRRRKRQRPMGKQKKKKKKERRKCKHFSSPKIKKQTFIITGIEKREKRKKWLMCNLHMGIFVIFSFKFFLLWVFLSLSPLSFFFFFFKEKIYWTLFEKFSLLIFYFFYHP